jgi:hypothetical protein
MERNYGVTMTLQAGGKFGLGWTYSAVEGRSAREIDGELLGIATGSVTAYVRNSISEFRHRIIILPWTAIRRKHP